MRKDLVESNPEFNNPEILISTENIENNLTIIKENL
jgi:hypothetical protein